MEGDAFGVEAKKMNTQKPTHVTRLKVSVVTSVTARALVFQRKIITTFNTKVIRISKITPHLKSAFQIRSFRKKNQTTNYNAEKIRPIAPTIIRYSDLRLLVIIVTIAYTEHTVRVIRPTDPVLFYVKRL